MICGRHYIRLVVPLLLTAAGACVRAGADEPAGTDARALYQAGLEAERAGQVGRAAEALERALELARAAPHSAGQQAARLAVLVQGGVIRSLALAGFR